MTRRIDSWGRYLKSKPASVQTLTNRHAALPNTSRSLLVFGNGCSYGDVCLNNGGDILLARGLDRFISFNPETGVLRAEAGVLLSAILDIIVPRGWFLPVTPGTGQVTLGGAVANDVHGKNHHQAGTIGCHVNALELVRSDGSRRICTPTENSDWLAATIGGMGLTGLIEWVEIRLCKVEGPYIKEESFRVPDLNSILDLFAESDREYEHTVAWIDCITRGAGFGRGVFIRGNHAPHPPTKMTSDHHVLRVPFALPVSLVKKTGMRLFNELYYRKFTGEKLVHYRSFFYPLDKVDDWNLLYGPRGFLQYQVVIPQNTAKDALVECFRCIASSREVVSLAVLKMFGNRKSPGLMSFPRPGASIALDFPFKGTRTLNLLNSLDEIVMQAGGALYPAKDSRMSPSVFAASFPSKAEFECYLDDAFSSGFKARVFTKNKP